MNIEALSKAFEQMMDGDTWGPYISANDENDFTLDGHFTLEQLVALVMLIDQHRTPQPDPSEDDESYAWWGEFLKARCNALHAMRRLGISPDAMVQQLNLENDAHANRIIAATYKDHQP